MSSKTTYLAFKDKKGNIISVAKKVIPEPTHEIIGIHLQPGGQSEAVTIDEGTYNKNLKRLISAAP